MYSGIIYMTDVNVAAHLSSYLNLPIHCVGEVFAIKYSDSRSLCPTADASGFLSHASLYVLGLLRDSSPTNIWHWSYVKYDHLSQINGVSSKGWKYNTPPLYVKVSATLEIGED